MTTNHAPVRSPVDRVDFVRRNFPAEGLFAEKEWLLSPSSFPLGEKLDEQLEKLGYRLNLFQRACNLLYQLSVKGKQPAWVAAYLDAGKPPELVALSRERGLRDQVPRIVRPDLVLTDEGFVAAELDSVPGGVGLTAWLNQTYAALGDDVVGGAEGMLDGFAGIMPDGGAILVSDEAATYRPEMVWLAEQLNQRAGVDGRWRVTRTDGTDSLPESGTVYRFIEHFDLPNNAIAPALLERAHAGRLTVTPPFKPYLEEKMWFALFWMRPLREFWRRELGERQWLELQKVIPQTWIVDPTPLPHHSVIPGLDIQSWNELGEFSQRKRELILKISGFSELAWGSRGVDMAADLPQHEWRAAIARALARFPKNPVILQQFHKGRLFDHPYFDPVSGTPKTLRGRVRLCPYYFIGDDGKASLRGALATICPADKKLLHGMKDAIIVPASR